MNVMVCGGAGFIGVNLIATLLNDSSAHLIVIDRLSYASHPKAIELIQNHKRISFFQNDIGDKDFILSTLRSYQPDIVINLAAETHVDNSIRYPDIFINNNVSAFHGFLEACRDYLNLTNNIPDNPFRFIHVSTDEVFGPIPDEVAAANEQTAYRPANPYSATKAAADHLVSAYENTFGLTANILYLSNNYGPYQHFEKLIPTIINSALDNRAIPIYGDGTQRRTWLNVRDTCEGILKVIERGKAGERYNLGSVDEIQNLDLAHRICEILDEIKPLGEQKHYQSLIALVQDRPGHDFRYSLDCKKSFNELSWRPKVSFQEGLFETVKWYAEQHTID